MDWDMTGYIQRLNADIDKVIPLLDQEKPGWRSMIDLTRFDIGDPDRCVLSYVYGDWFEATGKIYPAICALGVITAVFADPLGNDHWRAVIRERDEVE